MSSVGSCDSAVEEDDLSTSLDNSGADSENMSDVDNNITQQAELVQHQEAVDWKQRAPMGSILELKDCPYNAFTDKTVVRPVCWDVPRVLPPFECFTTRRTQRIVSTPLANDQLQPGGKTTLQEYFGCDAKGIAIQLITEALSHTQAPIIATEATVCSIAHGFSVAMDSIIDAIGTHAVGRMVASIAINPRTGVVQGYALAQLELHSLIDGDTGHVLGAMLHNVTKGFALDDNSRRLICSIAATTLLQVNNLG